jgi:membrane fusion protein (multidrug efflux system)
VIDSGLKAGEKIVVEGLQKVREGVTVNPTLVNIQETPSPTAPNPSAT